jgi:hypothetical protein
MALESVVEGLAEAQPSVPFWENPLEWVKDAVVNGWIGQLLGLSDPASDRSGNDTGLGTRSSFSPSNALPSVALSPMQTPPQPTVARSPSPEAAYTPDATPPIISQLSVASLSELDKIMAKMNTLPSNDNSTPFFSSDVSIADNFSPTPTPNVAFGRGGQSAGMSMA